jgi:hypothetical protein
MYAGMVRQRLDPERASRWLHPFLEISRHLARQERLTSRAQEMLERFRPSRPVSGQPVAMAAFRSLEQVVDKLPGWTEVHSLGALDCPWQYFGQSVLMVEWIAPWTPQVLLDSFGFPSELAATVHVVDPSRHYVPTVVSSHLGVTLRLVHCPTERKALHQSLKGAVRAVRADFDGHGVRPKSRRLPL